MLPLTLITALAFLPSATIDEKPTPAAAWLRDYADGKLRADETGKPMLVVFR
jgi:hypothetical protein